ncbi:MAG: WecB/TagA/CpsF family glycosyltransferase [Treponema sp.]|nr:WecB/TagA/CpsF family glycosyltransferase [Treponema sp.]
MDADKPVTERISLLKVPLDIVSRENLPEIVMEILSRGEGANIVLLSLWDLLKAKRSGEYRSFVTGASLVIPISKSLIRGAKFLTGKIPVRYMPFDFVISLLSILENREFSVYLLGGGRKILKKTEKNIRQTFPHLRVVGRFPGGFRRQEETGLLQAIRKASPSLLLVGKGVKGEEKWIARNSVHLSKGLRLWCSDLYDVFAERKKRPSRRVFESGLEWIGFCFRNPIRIFRFFHYLRYAFLLLVYKVSNKKK